jgi:formiminoglutamase
MPISIPNRLLRRAPQEAVFHSADPVSDPRYGDLFCAPGDVSDQRCVVVFIGVPQHLGVERNGGRSGAALAPSAIRRAFSRLATAATYQAIQQGALAIVDIGDIDTEGKTLEQIHDEAGDVIATLLRQKCIPIVMGGGHDTAWPTIRAMNSTLPSWCCINIDAHADVRPLLDGSRAHSGSPFFQMLSAPHTTLVPGGFAEIGLQWHAVSADHLELLRRNNATVLMLDDCRRIGVDGLTDAVNTFYAKVPLYMSLDMDSFASAWAPGVSAPASDGLSPYEVSAIVMAAASSGRLQAFDVVEVNPLVDVDGRTAKLAATMIADVLRGLVSGLG